MKLAVCCPNSADCCFFADIMDEYNHSMSSDYKKDGKSWSIEYGKGAAKGFLSKDTVTLGGLSVSNQVCYFCCVSMCNARTN